MNDTVKEGNIEKNGHDLVTVDAGLSPIVRLAMSKEIDPDKLQRLLDIQKDYESNEARKAYFVALSEFKKTSIDVIKDKINTQFGSRYTSKGNLVNTVNQALSPFGLTANWGFHQHTENGRISVTCNLSHAMGHTESVTLTAPPDDSGKKNPIQQIKSTITYLEIATYEAITGIAALDEGDDDGAGSSVSMERISEEQVNIINSKIKDNGMDMDKFLLWLKKSCGADSISDIGINVYADVLKMIESSINNRKKKGRGG